MAETSGPTGLEPVALALILCDYVHIDPATGRRTILGTFYALEAASFPTTYPKMAVYAALTDGRGRIPITIRLVDVDELGPPLWEDTEDVEFGDPHLVEEISTEVLDATFPVPLAFTGCNS